MTIYSLYIFDRYVPASASTLPPAAPKLILPASLPPSHCDCVYYHDWHRTRPVRAGPNDRPGVHRLPTASGPGARESIFSNANSNSNSASGSGSQQGLGMGQPGQQQQQQQGPAPQANGTGAASKRGLPFDEEAKLVYGVVLSLRNMVKKLSGK